MTEIPEDIMRAAAKASESAISSMCTTFRHDYGLPACWLQKAIYIEMSNIAYHEVRPLIAQAILAERDRCAKVAETMKPPLIMFDGESANQMQLINNSKRLVAHSIAEAIRKGESA